MSTKTKRMSAREAIATVVGCDYADVTQYQAGRYRRSVWLAGENYYTTRRLNEKAPRGWTPIMGDEWFTANHPVKVYVCTESPDNE